MNERYSYSEFPIPRVRIRLVFWLVPLFAALIFWRYEAWMFPVFYGDDLGYLQAFIAKTCATNPSEILIAVCLERFRPVAAGAVVLLMNFFGTKMVYYHVANALIQAVTAALVFAIAHRLTRGNLLLSLAITAAVALSRFATYHVTQVIGPVESITLAFALGVVYSVIRADAAPESAWRWGWIALFLTFLAIHTHERFSVLAAWLFGVFLVSPVIRGLPRARWFTLLAACIAVPMFYIFYKTMVLKTPFLIGTGGTHIKFNIPTILEHARLGGLSIFGFNQGPDYLAGMTVALGWNSHFIVALVFAACWMGLIMHGLRMRSKSDQTNPWRLIESLRWPIFLLVLAVLLLFPTLLTIHLEQRWLYAPFSVVMLMAAWAAGQFRSRSLAVAMGGAMAIASIILDTMIMQHYDRLFFVVSPRFAEMVKRDIIDASPGSTESVVLITAASHCNWTLYGGEFFKVYGGAHRPVYCFDSIEASLDAPIPAIRRIYREDAEGHLEDVTTESKRVGELRKSISFDFLKQFASGQTSNPDRVIIPHDGVRVLPWDSTSGPVQALTVVSGFIYRYDDVPIGHDNNLLFDVGMIYPAAQPARAVVRLRPEQGPMTIVFSRELSSPLADAKPAFERVAIPLSGYAGQLVSVEFATESASKHTSGQWIGYVSPRITVAPETTSD